MALGESLIPLINRLQDIFSQVRAASHTHLSAAVTHAHVHTRRSTEKLHARSHMLCVACNTLTTLCVLATLPSKTQVTVDLKLTLPQVAVIGSQSSGKSSVLESLVGLRGMNVLCVFVLVIKWRS